MKHLLKPSLALAFIYAASLMPAFCESPKVAYVEAWDWPSGRMRLGEMISGLDYRAENATEDIEFDTFEIQKIDILVFGSDCTGNRGVRTLLEYEAESLRNFVHRGGCVLMFSQSSGIWSKESWLPQGMFLLRGKERFSRLGYLDRKHPLFSTPNTIFHRRLNDYWQEEDLSRDTFRLVLKGWVLAAQDEAGRDPWCVEFGWGKGRVIFFACEPERREGGRAETKKMAMEVLENSLAYASAVVKNRPAPLPDHVIVSETKLARQSRAGEQDSNVSLAFEEEVNAAVDRGVAYLKLGQRDDGSWGAYGILEYGPTALAIVAVLGAGVNKHKPFVQKAMDFICRNAGKRYDYASYTYDVGLILMALDACAAPLYERFELGKLPPEKRERFKFRRDLSEQEKALMQIYTNWLEKTQGENGGWSYGGDFRGRGMSDISNTQYAVLGLKAASRCGYKVSEKVWIQLIEALLELQAESGPEVTLPEFMFFNHTRGKANFRKHIVRARPWGYRFMPRNSGATGSRTAIGVASLIIAFEELSLRSKSKASLYSRKVSKAVLDGLGWLFANWSVEENPEGEGFHYFYYLYALERAGVLYGNQFIGDRDWYLEGAAHLLSIQDPAGSWGRDIVSTCFALMFLKRSTPPPVVTIGK